MSTAKSDPLKQTGATLDDVLEVASQTREWLEQLNQKIRVFQPDLAGACGLGAFVNARLLEQTLQLRSVDVVMAIGGDEYGHCWTEFDFNDERYVIDVTATQFGLGARLLLEPASEYQDHDFIDGFLDQVWTGDEAIKRFAQWSPREQPMTYQEQLKEAFPAVAHLVVHPQR